MSRRYKILIIAVIGAFALLLGFRPLFLLFYAALAGYAIAPLWARIQTSGISAEIRSSTAFLEAGQPLPIEVSLFEFGGKPHWGLRVTVDDGTAGAVSGYVHETTMDLPPHTARRWLVILASRPRGMIQVGPASIQGSDPMGFHNHVRRLGAERQMLVYPRIVPLRVEFPPGVREGRESIRATQPAHGTASISRLRDHEPGDPISRIHWYTSARMGRLMTAEREDDEIEDAVWVALNLDRSVQSGFGEESTTEYGVTIAASLTTAFLDADVPVGLLVSGPGRVVFPAERGESQRERILESLALARVGSRYPAHLLLDDYRLRTGPSTHLFFVTPTIHRETAGAADQWGTDPSVTWIALDRQSFALPPGVSPEGEPGQSGNGVTVRRGDDLAAALSAAIAQTMVARVEVG
ncbi:MAG: DUF58 domain-containing protein [Chloroflexi bacterium]|nr:DUF58 domain-containing protein [Chloroflexota bacterium]